jgi:hypothetical protein
MGIASKIKRSYHSRRFDWLVRGVLNTKPLEPRDDEPTIVSMLCHRDVMMYLLAIKSFYRNLGRGRIIIINDGTLTRDDKELLKKHVKPSWFVEAKSLVSDDCPSYISWKKLLCIAQYVQKSFTIQLDSDTLTVGDIKDVQKCIDSDTSFILGTWENQTIDSMVEACEAVQSESSHDFQNLRYARGCSGFDGFAKSSFDLGQLESLSKQMFGIIGDKWNEWGSEQTASNIVVANSARATVLPYPKYYSYWGTVEKADFIHFVGTYRFSGGVYAREARKVIETLRVT